MNNDVLYLFLKEECACAKFSRMCPLLPPHRGLPPCRGGGAYAPMTRTICNLKERS